MKKILKFILSRFAIISFLLLFEFIILVTLIFKVNASFSYFYIISSIFSIFVLIFLICKEESPSYKVPWIIVILTIPFVGWIIYILFSRSYINKKQRKKYYSVAVESFKYIFESINVKEELSVDNLVAFNQTNFIFRSCWCPVRKNTSSLYLNDGSVYFSKLLEALKSAKKFIFLEYFIIEEGRMWNTILEILKEKVLLGLDVRVMFDDFGCITKLPYAYNRKLEKMGIKCCVFNKYKPFLSAIHNNRDHRKIAVVDGIKGLTGGINLADEYINDINKFGYWKDTGIYLEGGAVNNLTIMFLQTWEAHYDKIDSMNLDLYKDFILNETDIDFFPSDGFVQPFCDGPEPVYKEKIGENVYLNLINCATKYLYITTPYLIVDYIMMNALKNAAKRGVDVRIITPHIPDKKTIFIMTRSSYMSLIEAGVKIYEYEKGFIHAKTFVVDDEYGVVGTINLDYRSLVHHFENAVWMYKTSAVAELKKDFDETLKSSIFITKDKAKLTLFQKIVKSILQVFAPLM